MTMFIFAGGGSGGHIFPALAIHEELARNGGHRGVFVCSDRKLDAEILTREGADFRIVPAKPLSASLRGTYRFMMGWGPSVRLGRSLIGELRSRNERVQVVAMGGFVAAPIVQAALAEHTPVLLVNLDAVPGKANRLIARRLGGQRIVTSVPVVGPCANLGWTVVPPIVRRNALTATSAAECRKSLGLDPDRRTLLVTGGSQGAVSINRMVLRALEDQPGAFEGWQVIHQAGRNEEGPARSAYAAARVPAVVRAFFERMGEAWRASDLAVSRAGAGGVAEAWAYGVPTLFMPNPYHRDQHQRHNARRLEEVGGAFVVEDRIDAARNDEAVEKLGALMVDPETLMAMRRNLESLGAADGAAQVSRLLFPPTPSRCLS